MKNDFRTSLLIRLISFTIAVFAWATITNLIRPVVSDFISIPVTVTNEAAIKKLNKAYIVKSPLMCRVSYKIDAERQSMVRLSDFNAYVDLNDLLTTNDLPIHYETPNGIDKYISNIRIEPKTVRIVLDDAVRTEIPVLYDFSGKIDERHSIGNVILSPNVVSVSGGDEVLKNISHVSISIPISNQDDNFTGVAKIQVIGHDGKEIRNLGAEFDTNEINYSVSIFTRANVALNLVTTGELPKECKLLSETLTPETVIVEGPRSVIENLYSIDLPPIDLTDAKETIEQIVSLKENLPEGTRCTSTEAVRVKIAIENSIIDEPIVKSTVLLPKKSDVSEQTD